MANRNNDLKTLSRTSPKGGRRGCLCPDGTYSSKCCDGSLQAQGIGVMQKVPEPFTLFILKEDGDWLIKEDSYNILKEN